MIDRARRRLRKRAKIREDLAATLSRPYGPDDRRASRLTVGIVPVEPADVVDLRRRLSQGSISAVMDCARKGAHTYAREKVRITSGLAKNPFRRGPHSLRGTPLRKASASSPITRSRSSAKRRPSKPSFTDVCNTARMTWIFAFNIAG